MAEVLITLGIIGVVAALVMPALISNYRKSLLKNQFKKAHSTVSQAWKQAEADLEFVPECHYPTAASGVQTDCALYRDTLEKRLNIVKKCNGNALRDKCIPDYLGLESVKQNVNPGLSDEDAMAATVGCVSWRKNAIDNNNKVWVLADGTIIMHYSTIFPALFALDVNGKKPPNKWGHDIFVFSTWNGPNDSIYIAQGVCQIVDIGGLTTSEMIMEVNK